MTDDLLDVLAFELLSLALERFDLPLDVGIGLGYEMLLRERL